MRYHHHEHNFLRGSTEEIFNDEGITFDETLELDEEGANVNDHHRAKARRMIEEHLERRKNKVRDIDPFEDESFWS